MSKKKSRTGSQRAHSTKSSTTKQTNSLPLQQQLAQAVTAHQSGQIDDAILCYKHILTKVPNHPDVLGLLGTAYAQTAQFEPAEPLLRQSIKLNPKNTSSLANLAWLLRSVGRHIEALPFFEEAIHWQPNNLDAWLNWAKTLSELGRIPDAQHILTRAIVSAHPNMETWLEQLSQAIATNNDEQQQQYRTYILQACPGIPKLLNNKGSTHNQLEQLSEAHNCYRSALVLDDRSLEAWINLGILCQDKKEYQQAILYFQKAYLLNPQHPITLDSLTWLNLGLLMWDRWPILVEQIHALVDQGNEQIKPFTYLALPGATRSRQLKKAATFVQGLCGHDLAHAPKLALPPPRTRLRIGYLSADFYAHATSILLSGVFEQHDRTKIEVYVYAYGPHQASAERDRISKSADVFRDIQELNCEQATTLIRQDELDILVDLKGYTHRAWIRLVAQRLAPIQVNWLGYPGTIGDHRMADWIISDAIVTPLEHAADYAETLALLPRCYQPNDRSRPNPHGELSTRAQYGLPENTFVFCSFNQIYKAPPDTFDLWAAVLQAVPNSVFWVWIDHESTRERAKTAFQVRGVDPARIIFAKAVPINMHMSRIKLADCALDSWPIGSHTTASDMLWGGIPLVTLNGDTFVSRVAASILTHAGLPELVAKTADQYVKIAQRVAQDTAFRQQLQTTIHKISRDILFDVRSFTQDLERLYQRMVEQHRVGNKNPIVLDPKHSTQ